MFLTPLEVQEHQSHRSMSHQPLSTSDSIEATGSEESVPLNNSHPSSSRSSSVAESRLLTSLKPHQLSFVHGLAIVISLQIGSGIFAAPTQVSRNVSSPGLGVIVWVTGGLLVWTGSIVFHRAWPQYCQKWRYAGVPSSMLWRFHGLCVRLGPGLHRQTLLHCHLSRQCSQSTYVLQSYP